MGKLNPIVNRVVVLEKCHLAYEQGMAGTYVSLENSFALSISAKLPVPANEQLSLSNQLIDYRAA